RGVYPWRIQRNFPQSVGRSRERGAGIRVSTFYLIRHAEKHAPENVLAGRAPHIHLTERGRRQAEAVAAHLASYPIQQVFSSPASRARETARPLADAKALPIQISAAFHEVDFGE